MLFYCIVTAYLTIRKINLCAEKSRRSVLFLQLEIKKIQNNDFSR